MNSGHKIIVLFTRNPISSDIDGFPFHSMYTYYTRILHINKSEKKLNNSKKKNRGLKKNGVKGVINNGMNIKKKWYTTRNPSAFYYHRRYNAPVH